MTNTQSQCWFVFFVVGLPDLCPFGLNKGRNSHGSPNGDSNWVATSFHILTDSQSFYQHVRQLHCSYSNHLFSSNKVVSLNMKYCIGFIVVFGHVRVVHPWSRYSNIFHVSKWLVGECRPAASNEHFLSLVVVKEIQCFPLQINKSNKKNLNVQLREYFGSAMQLESRIRNWKGHFKRRNYLCEISPCGTANKVHHHRLED